MAEPGSSSKHRGLDHLPTNLEVDLLRLLPLLLPPHHVHRLVTMMFVDWSRTQPAPLPMSFVLCDRTRCREPSTYSLVLRETPKP
jgi:hypothetical protein